MQSGNGFQIKDVHQGVGRRLRPDQFRVWTDRCPEGIQIPQIDKLHIQAMLDRNGRQQAVRAAIQIVVDDDVVACGKEGDSRCLCRHACAEGKPVRTAFEGGDTVLQGLARRIPRSGIVERPHLPDALIGKGRYLINGLHHSAVGRVGFLPGVNRKCFKFHDGTLPLVFYGCFD